MLVLLNVVVSLVYAPAQQTGSDCEDDNHRSDLLCGQRFRKKKICAQIEAEGVSRNADKRCEEHEGIHTSKLLASRRFTESFLPDVTKLKSGQG